METTKETKRYKIPQDLLMDILRILFSNNIRHHITGIQQRENNILLNVHFKPNDANSEEAKENIADILKEYSEYMKGLLGDTILMLDEEETD